MRHYPLSTLNSQLLSTIHYPLSTINYYPLSTLHSPLLTNLFRSDEFKITAYHLALSQWNRFGFENRFGNFMIFLN
ncbi:MAG: hypothetical protein LBE12_15010 [Planctomycetaceae bacterium]|nr:hypothetical protein [Planctomycetaceae bacterium]